MATRNIRSWSKGLILVAAAMLAAGLVFGGCGDSTTGNNQTPGDPTQDEGGTTPVEDVGEPDEDTTQPDPKDTKQPEPDVAEGEADLDFVMAMGDDKNKCKGTDRCAITLSFNGDRDLEVVATKGGKGLNEEEIAWKLTKNPGNGLKLTANSLYSGEDGKATNKVTDQGNTVEQYELEVTLPGYPNVAPIYFDIAVLPKEQYPLVVQYQYMGKRNFQGVKTFLFKHVGEAAFPCTEMDPNNLPTADVSSPMKSLEQSTTFTKLSGLEEEGTQTYTVVGIGADKNGPPLVWGCDDQKAVVTWVGGQTVLVQLGDLPPSWKGDYAVTTKFDLVSALPDNIEKIVNTVLGFFMDPSGQLLVLICDYGGSVGVIEDLCGFVFNEDYPDAPCLTPEAQCFTTIGLTIKNLLTNLLNSLLEDTVAGDIFAVGADVSSILKKLELSATFTFKNEPAADGTFTTEDTHEDWHSITYKWTLGTNCPLDDESCGKHKFNMSAFQDSAVEGEFSGHVEYVDDKNLLHIDPHGLNINYGKLISYILQKQILPLIAGDGSDGYPKIDSFEEYIKMLLGGKECLLWEIDPEVPDTCCTEFAKNITNSVTQDGFSYDLVKIACEAGLPLAVDQLTNLLEGLTLESESNFTIGTAEACQCFDHDANMTIDAWGESKTPCKWDTVIKFGDTEVKIDNDFWAIEKQ